MSINEVVDWDEIVEDMKKVNANLKPIFTIDDEITKIIQAWEGIPNPCGEIRLKEDDVCNLPTEDSIDEGVI